MEEQRFYYYKGAYLKGKKHVKKAYVEDQFHQKAFAKCFQY